MTGRLEIPSQFDEYLPWFLIDNPSEWCAKAGHAAYSHAVDYVLRPNSTRTQVQASYFMSYHTILKTSADYYEALRNARKLSANMTNMINNQLKEWGEEPNIEVFPYSVFYVFYEQYLTMWPDTLKSLGISLAAIFVVTFLLMGMDFFCSLVVIITITMIIVNIGGLMYWWHITLNAISLVNLVMVSCSHWNVKFLFSELGFDFLFVFFLGCWYSC